MQTSPLRSMMQVLGSWPRDKALRFLHFATGSDRLPLPGSEMLKIEAPFVAFGMAAHKQQLGMLPQVWSTWRLWHRLASIAYTHIYSLAC